jgi:dihydrofolate reductase
VHTYANEQAAAMSGFLHGRVMYELMEEFWPTADTDPDSTPPMVEFAGIWRETPKYVYSTTLRQVGPNSTLFRVVVPEEVRTLAAAADGDLGLGGPNLVSTFRRHDLVDEYRLLVHPVVLGRGRPLFEPSDPQTDLEFVETRTFGNGVVLLRYRRP